MRGELPQSFRLISSIVPTISSNSFFNCSTSSRRIFQRVPTRVGELIEIWKNEGFLVSRSPESLSDNCLKAEGITISTLAPGSWSWGIVLENKLVWFEDLGRLSCWSSLGGLKWMLEHFSHSILISCDEIRQ